MSHGSTAALTPAQSAPLSLVARVVRIGLRMVAKPVLRANLSVEAARWQLRLANRLIPRPPRGTETTVIDAGGVPAERVTTAASRRDRHILYLHGGGYVAGWAGLCRDLTWRLATLCRVCVLGVNYRPAPEHPFPAALDDAVAAYRWLLAQGADPKRIALVGDSFRRALAAARRGHRTAGRRSRGLALDRSRPSRPIVAPQCRHRSADTGRTGAACRRSLPRRGQSAQPIRFPALRGPDGPSSDAHS